MVFLQNSNDMNNFDIKNLGLAPPYFYFFAFALLMYSYDKCEN